MKKLSLKSILAALFLVSTATMPAQTSLCESLQGQNHERQDKPIKLPPASNSQTTPALSESEINWGEWYQFDTGKFYYGPYYLIFGDRQTTLVTVMRRDSDDGNASQLCFKGAFGTTDFLVNLDPKTNAITWDEQVLPYTYEDSSFPGGFLHLASTQIFNISYEWSQKNDIVMTLWYLTDEDRGFPSEYAGYSSDNKNDWGDWYQFDTGTFYHGDGHTHLGTTGSTHVTVMRRDSKDSTASQLSFKGAFGTTDFLVNLDPETNKMTWKEQLLPYTDETSSFPGGYLHLYESTGSGILWKPKFNIDIYFFFLTNDGFGYESKRAGYVSDNRQPDPEISLKVLTEPIKEGLYLFGRDTKEISIEYKNINKIAARAEFTWLKNGIYVDENGVEKAPGKESIQVLTEGVHTLSFYDGPGTYTFMLSLYDSDGDYVGGRRLNCLSNIDDGYEWHPIGKGLFDPTFLSVAYDAILNHSSSHYNHVFTPNILEITDPYEVVVEERNDAPGVYRVVDPFGPGTPFADIDVVGLSNTYTDENGTQDINDPEWLVLDHSEPFYIVIDTRNEKKPFVESRATGVSYCYYKDLTTWTGSKNNEFFLSRDYNDDLTIKDGVIKAGFQAYPDFTLRLPDAVNAKPVLNCRVEEYEHDTRETMFDFHPSPTGYVNVAVDYDVPADAIEAKIAAVPLDEYDENSTVDRILNGEIESTETYFDNYDPYRGLSGTIKVKLARPLKTENQNASPSSTTSSADVNNDLADFKIVFVTTDLYNRPRSVTTADIAVPAVDNPQLLKIGKATFNDPVAQAYGLNYTKTTDVYENPEQKGVYHLISPWQFEPIYLENQFKRHCTENHNWVIDARNPNRVTVIKGFTGLTDTDIAPPAELYAIDCATYWCLLTCESLDSLDDTMFGRVTTDTESVKCIIFNKFMLGIHESGQYDITDSCLQPNKPLNIEITLTPSAVETITTDNDDNSAIEYYNLQGIKVDNPTPGLYIRRQGGKTTKILVR